MSSALSGPLRFMKMRSFEKSEKYFQIDFEVDDSFEFYNKIVTLREGEALLSKFLTKDEHFKGF